MSKVVFGLKPFPSPSDSHRPVISMIFKNPNDEKQTFPVIGLLDSGADNCTLPLSSQSELGLDLKNMGAKKIPMGCACGNKTFFGYQYKLNVEFEDIEGKKYIRLLWIDFADSDTMPLIGRNFMDIFKNIEYDNSKKEGFLIDPRKE